MIRFSPQTSNQRGGNNFAMYCKYELMKHTNWFGDKAQFEKYCGDGKVENEQWIKQWEQLIQSKEDQQTKQNRLLSELLQGDLEIEYEELPDEHRGKRIDLIYGADAPATGTPPLTAERIKAADVKINDDSVSWDAQYQALPEEIRPMLSTWLDQQKRLGESDPNLFKRDIHKVDPSTLNHEQRVVYDRIKMHFEDPNPNKDPLFLIVYGTAGTGKSHCVHAFYGFLGNVCKLTATTGMAAYNINGCTLQSFVNMNYKGDVAEMPELSEAAVLDWQRKYGHILYIVIDEMSMLGQRSLLILDKRLRQLTGKGDKPFGGLSIILVGDFGQLPPVKDSPMYSDKIPVAKEMLQMFSSVMLKQVKRQEESETEFRELLMNMRDCKLEQDQWQLLLNRDPSKVKDKEHFSNAMHIFPTHKLVDEFNWNAIVKQHKELGKPIVCIKANNSKGAAKLKPEELMGLQKELFLTEGSKVILTRNIWTDVGLVNGAQGIVQSIIYAPGTKPSTSAPLAIIVKFPNSICPSIYGDENPHCVPIVPFTAECVKNNKKVTRSQFPLRSGDSDTIYHVQGQTLQSVVIGLQGEDMCLGLTFVALSRVRRLIDLMISATDFQRYLKARNPTSKKSFKMTRNLRSRLKIEKWLESVDWSAKPAGDGTKKVAIDELLLISTQELNNKFKKFDKSTEKKGEKKCEKKKDAEVAAGFVFMFFHLYLYSSILYTIHRS